MSRKFHGVEEALLGFDAREMFLEPGGTWPPERRRNFLLREDVQTPLSVDPAVWPSLFGEGRAPGWRGPNQGLWDSLSRMQGFLGPRPSEAYWTVAVSWVSVEGFSESGSAAGPYRERMEPEAVSADWTLLGFDVADAGFISGLSNCGYTPEEAAGLRATWASSLNAHHLFDDLEKALAFRELREARVSEHAPFFVYALRRIIQVRGT